MYVSATPPEETLWCPNGTTGQKAWPKLWIWKSTSHWTICLSVSDSGGRTIASANESIVESHRNGFPNRAQQRNETWRKRTAPMVCWQPWCIPQKSGNLTVGHLQEVGCRLEPILKSVDNSLRLLTCLGSNPALLLARHIFWWVRGEMERRGLETKTPPKGQCLPDGALLPFASWPRYANGIQRGTKERNTKAQKEFSLLPCTRPLPLHHHHHHRH